MGEFDRPGEVPRCFVRLIETPPRFRGVFTPALWGAIARNSGARRWWVVEAADADAARAAIAIERYGQRCGQIGTVLHYGELPIEVRGWFTGTDEFCPVAYRYKGVLT